MKYKGVLSLHIQPLELPFQMYKMKYLCKHAT